MTVVHMCCRQAGPLDVLHSETALSASMACVICCMQFACQQEVQDKCKVCTLLRSVISRLLFAVVVGGEAPPALV